MSILSEINTLSNICDIPIETGVFSDNPPDIYLVATPLVDLFEVYADNLPEYEVQELRLSLFSKGNYIKIKNTLTRTLLGAGFTITDMRYLGHEDDTGYHHYALDVAKSYKFKLDKED
ncbi:hypothetical protein TSYNTROOL_22160 [Tepidanaerobacter syntrophicus]|jgi:hypothetical protein|uniref:Uncharacterized protein n=2 Tax=Bacillota TaxID=1239 RepID=A0A430AYY3_9ENTE|nr:MULTISPECIES: hypothetical protein [Bacillota]MBC8591119.1 hypothetical protein [Wansuia hejianensis]RSU13282.1 hypothetical protein CBF27_03615 [Vagococcus acidifermentans]GLI52130.1 hypothetical protein TSYNTROOL_22160 [Tepidanaerobacter syntrophicus]